MKIATENKKKEDIMDLFKLSSVDDSKMLDILLNW